MAVVARKVVPGAETNHDAFEGLLDVVWQQEHLWRLTERLNAEIDRDESRARGRAPTAQRAERQRTPRRPRRKRHQRSDPGLRHQREREEPEPSNPAQTAAGLVILCLTAFSLSVLGTIFAGIVKAVRILL